VSLNKIIKKTPDCSCLIRCSPFTTTYTFPAYLLLLPPFLFLVGLAVPPFVPPAALLPGALVEALFVLTGFAVLFQRVHPLLPVPLPVPPPLLFPPI
jgi:hypothetical protein